MANEFARNIQDAAVSPIAFVLPAAASTSTNSTTLDLGAGNYQPDNLELELSVPALSTTIAPDTRTVTLIIETCLATNFSTIDQTLYSEAFAGAGGAGIGAKVKRVRVPSNCARYIRAKVTFGASTTDGSAVSATFTVRF